jgi:hypothetical protein
MRGKDNFIPGIYNYCDRWCERCTFTSRCRNYEGTGKLEPEQLDINNKKFWDTISANFTNAMELLHKIAKEKGIDLDTIMTKEEEKQCQRRESFLRKTVKQHELTKLCRQYQEIVLPFFEKQISSDLVDKTKELVSHLHMGMRSDEEVAYTMAGLGDCESIIRWYVFFIDVKLQRALHGKLEGEQWEKENGYAKDSDGSAKIAIIAIERSIGAWTRLYELLPSSEDTALDALTLLSRLKQKAIAEFPQAMYFKRPGFDDDSDEKKQ